MNFQQMSLETMASQIGRANPLISGSTASLVAAQLGVAMARMALCVSSKHGHDNDEVVDRLDAVAAGIRAAAEQDREASANLIQMLGSTSDVGVRSSLLREATMQPLSAACLIIEFLNDMNESRRGVHPSVESDFFGAMELLSGAFTAIMLAVESNIRQESTGALADRTVHTRSELRRRQDVVLGTLRFSASCGG